MARGKNTDLDLAVDKNPAVDNKKSPLLGMLINIGIGLLLVAVNVGATYVLVNLMLEQHYTRLSMTLGGANATAGGGGRDADAASGKPPIFISLDPVFVVNFGEIEEGRFLQAEIEVMTRDSDVSEAIKSLMPMIRNGIIMILGQQTVDTISTREGMDALQQEVLKEVTTILETYSGKSGVEKVYFTSFVTQ